MPVIDVRDLIWFRQSAPKQWQNLDDFKGLTFGRTFGFQYGDAFEEAAKSGLFSVEEALSLVPEVNAIIKRLKKEGKIKEIFLGKSSPF